MYPYIHLFGREIGTYGLCMLLGIALATVLGIRRGKSRGLQFEDVLIVGAFSLGLALISGSLLFVFVTYTPKQIWQYICMGDFKFLSSGIVFYGGLIGGILGAFIGIRVADCKFSAMESAVFPTAVGPVNTINGRFSIKPNYLSIYTIRLNFFSISYFVIAIIVGLPCGH